MNYNKKLNKLTRAATDEIFGSVSRASTGNYWINGEWNLFCEKGWNGHGNEVYGRFYEVSLENYDEKGDLIDCQYDYQVTEDMTVGSLEKAIKELLERNKEIWIDS